MPRASKATLDVRPRFKQYSGLPRRVRIGAPKSVAQTITARIPTALTNTALKSTAQTITARIRTGPTNIAPRNTILKNTDPTWERETAGLHRKEEIE